MGRPSKILVMTTILAGFLAGCGRVPSHPDSVPPDAVWGGEGNRGVFLKVGEHQARSGSWMCGTGGPLPGVGFLPSAWVWKGQDRPGGNSGLGEWSLHLKDGTWLVPEPPTAR